MYLRTQAAIYNFGNALDVQTTISIRPKGGFEENIVILWDSRVP